MNKWQQFEHILRNTLPSYKKLTKLSCSCEIVTDYPYKKFKYEWVLLFNTKCGLYEELLNISKFCEIEWEQAYWDDLNTKFVLSEQIYELIEPVYW